MESFPDEAQNMLLLFSFMTLSLCFFFYQFKLPKSSSQTKFLLTPSDKKINHHSTLRLCHFELFLQLFSHILLCLE
jgi:hypothetical protein